MKCKKKETINKLMNYNRRQKEFIKNGCRHFGKNAESYLILENHVPIQCRCKICGAVLNGDEELRGYFQSVHDFFEEHPAEEPEQWFRDYMEQRQEEVELTGSVMVDLIATSEK